MVRLMLSLAAFLFIGLPATAAIWPAQWREHTLSKSEPVAVAETDLWAEFQGEAAEKASYKGPIGPFSGTAWRLQDATSALAWYQQVRPGNCTPARGSSVVCTTPGSQYMAVKNYVLKFEGWRPQPKEIEALEAALPNARSGGGLPKLPELLPEKGRVRNSERYVLGVQSLATYEPRIPAILAGFEDGAEAEVARYRTPAGEVAMTLFHYPSPQLARKYQPGFEKQPGFVVKRSGTMLAVVPGGHDPSKLESILGPVEWHINFTWNEATKAPPMPDVAGMLISIFELTGLLLVICVGGGLAFAGFWIYLRRREARNPDGDGAMITLHIGQQASSGE